jgi:hypothetical protein
VQPLGSTEALKLCPHTALQACTIGLLSQQQRHLMHDIWLVKQAETPAGAFRELTSDCSFLSSTAPAGAPLAVYMPWSLNRVVQGLAVALAVARPKGMRWSAAPPADGDVWLTGVSQGNASSGIDRADCRVSVGWAWLCVPLLLVQRAQVRLRRTFSTCTSLRCRCRSAGCVQWGSCW